MDKKGIDFKEIVWNIEENKILLPDFQRKFVWTDEEQQKKIVASVLARMPIGSILLLDSKPNEYSSKAIGSRKTVDISKLQDRVKFLLDGQQRMTVLTNVFSNAIHDSCNKVSELISPSLKRRFFLRIPKWKKSKEEEDLFGVHELVFKYQHPDSEDPEFLTSNIMPFIEVETFLADDKSPINPKTELSTTLDEYCYTHNKDGYLIPLFLLIPLDNNKRKSVLRLKTIIHNIAFKIKDEIIDEFSNKISDFDKSKFIKEIFITEDMKNNVLNDNLSFEQLVTELADTWEEGLKSYLYACIGNISLNEITVSESQRGRAIDIYENLNRGGVSLSTFDLIMARVAIVSTDNFYERLVKNINKKRRYPIDVVPEVIKSRMKELLDKGKYNASVNIDCYNEDKNEIVSTYIDVFLNVLSLYCYNPEYKYEDFKIDNMKRDKILSLKPKQIDQNCEKVCTAIDRAMFFFQTRCGIRNIQEVNYSLLIVLVATVFMKDEWYTSVKMHKRLEALYWSVLFSGTYDKDQNVRMISSLQQIIKTERKECNEKWLNSLKDEVLNAKFFSNKEFLLMGDVNIERYPKAVIKNFFCQYLLAQTYTDMFSENKTINVFMDKVNELEAHHIIPLGSAKNIGQSAKQLRKKNNSIYNSPLNFVYITRESNKKILDDPLSEYVTKITKQAKSKLYITAFTQTSDEDKTKGILSDRFDSMQGDIKEHIEQLIDQSK
ncbi:hypothetical protein CLRAG_09790 [Clostridium ragsdalei P11]|uniref:GmrSD restriction endonucleases N-terminal domain-containing protein n=1 Tax=Clostridium ragsdalei P11 TaxID=1353534 RepID=A0A1A6AYH0_9CLOT|nr:DUF262 domain-containing protein [Clostridium ragsdalei]OBR95141.1 hypothetical protein CLRAG_09790 [Clostridium ragsdalei P11]